jgi:hypothetical protein
LYEDQARPDDDFGPFLLWSIMKGGV